MDRAKKEILTSRVFFSVTHAISLNFHLWQENKDLQLAHEKMEQRMKS